LRERLQPQEAIVIYSIALSALFAELTARLTSLNDQLLSGMNGMAGRSWFFDSLVGLT